MISVTEVDAERGSRMVPDECASCGEDAAIAIEIGRQQTHRTSLCESCANELRKWLP